jgi:uridine kinase
MIIGIAGGSGSGKTTFARALAQALVEAQGEGHCALLAQDRYFIDQSARFTGDGESVNFDIPEAIDFPLMRTHLGELKAGRKVALPLYDFATHKRLARTDTMAPVDFVLVDGTLILSQETIRDCLDRSFFVDCPEALRFERRLKRDVRERGRTPEGVRKQFERHVKPMHDLHVEPSKAHASHVISGDAPLAPTIALWARRILAERCP